MAHAFKSANIEWSPGRSPSEYEATTGGIKFYTWHSCDAGFGLTARRVHDEKQLYPAFSIGWMRTRKNCVARAEQILRTERVA
jgi:hypothetical protein